MKTILKKKPKVKTSLKVESVEYVVEQVEDLDGDKDFVATKITHYVNGPIKSEPIDEVGKRINRLSVEKRLSNFLSFAFSTEKRTVVSKFNIDGTKKLAEFE